VDGRRGPSAFEVVDAAGAFVPGVDRACRVSLSSLGGLIVVWISCGLSVHKVVENANKLERKSEGRWWYRGEEEVIPHAFR
jgi:hypothetical protein